MNSLFQPMHKKAEKACTSLLNRPALPTNSAPSHPQAIIQRARLKPDLLTPQDILALQSSIGNQATKQFLSPTDFPNPTDSTRNRGPTIQRRGRHKDRTTTESIASHTVQRLKTKPVGLLNSSGYAPKNANPGMPAQVQLKMEESFNADFSNVEIQPHAAQAAKIGARAFTKGHRIFFAPGEYQPTNQRGQALLGHELAHVVQQQQGRVKPSIQAYGLPINAAQPLEQEAEEAGQKAAQGKQTKLAGAQRTAIEAQPKNDNPVVQGYWKELALATALIAGGIATGGTLGLLAGGAGTLLGAHTLYTGARATPNYLLHYRYINGVHPLDYRDIYDTVKSEVGNDPAFHFDDTQKEFKTTYNYTQLLEQSSAMRGYARNLVPGDVDGSRDLETKFIRLYGTSAYIQSVQSGKKSLEQQTEARLQKYQNNKDDQQINKALMQQYTKTLQEEGTTKGLKTILDKHGGLIIGESHKEADAKQLLTVQINTLAANNVDTLYLEHFREEYQTLLDEWSQQQDNAMPPALKKMTEANDDHWQLSTKQFNLLNLVQAAHAKGIRIVGIDSLAAKSEPGDEEGQYRTLSMNVFAESIIRKDRKNKAGKYVLLVGKQHANTLQPKGKPRFSVKNLPGLSQLLKLPSVTYNADTDELQIDIDKHQAERENEM